MFRGPTALCADAMQVKGSLINILSTGKQDAPTLRKSASRGGRKALAGLLGSFLFGENNVQLNTQRSQFAKQTWNFAVSLISSSLVWKQILKII